MLLIPLIAVVLGSMFTIGFIEGLIGEEKKYRKENEKLEQVGKDISRNVNSYMTDARKTIEIDKMHKYGQLISKNISLSSRLLSESIIERRKILDNLNKIKKKSIMDKHHVDLIAQLNQVNSHYKNHQRTIRSRISELKILLRKVNISLPANLLIK